MNIVDWNYIDAKYPTKLDKESMTKEEYCKQRTLELYDYLPQTTLEERRTYTDIRDAVIDLNYTFFGYIATHTFINNSSVTYEDKFQSALLHFTEMWEKFRYAPKYRTDLSFAVFFKPRVGECIERELNEVKYSLRRTLCMEVGAQLGKHWGQVKYDDLKDPRLKLSAEKMDSLRVMFGTMYWADLESHALFIESNPHANSCEGGYFSDDYDSITELLMHEMVLEESKLNDAQLLELSTTLDIPFNELKALLPEAERLLKEDLERRIDLQDSFEL